MKLKFPPGNFSLPIFKILALYMHSLAYGQKPSGSSLNLETPFSVCKASLQSLDGKQSTCMALIPGSGRSPGEGNGYLLQYSCLENSMDRGVSAHLLFGHFQFALIHGPNIPGSYAILLFTASDLASITSQYIL